ncbi:MAG: ribosome small subunit-dependent GTPase A [Neptuniibacter sp.]
MQIHNLHDLGWSHFFQSQLDLDLLTTQLPFRVFSVHRNLIECVGLDTEYQVTQIQLSTYPWRNDLPEDHPTVGDWLMLDHAFEPQQLLERKTRIQRRAAGKDAWVQMIAANIDTLFITTSCNDDFNLNRIERYLAIAAESGIHCVLVLTKVDLCDDASVYTDELSASHPELDVELVDATDAESLSKLEKWIGAGQTVALVGSSGVGKSTITNSLKGSEDQSTAAIRSSDSKGRHTTTSRSLHCLPTGGLLLDTPGMRELQIVDSKEGINTAFDDITELAQGCRFKNCQHNAEPGCAVVAAIKTGNLDQRRLDNYQKLLAEQLRNSATIAERRQADKALGRFYKDALQSAKRFKSRD